MGRPRHSLLDFLDEEDQFLHRPYVASFFPGLEGLHRIYQEGEFITRNIRSLCSEGVFDIWQLILRPQMLPGFIITNTVSAAGGAYWPYAYRPDRVCRQFGLDQPPRCISMEFIDVSSSMKVVFFKPSSSLPSYDAGRFVPLDRAGRVVDLWIAYYARLKKSVKRYEGQDSMQHFTNVQIMCKDPYYTTSSFKAVKAKDSPRADKKHKVAPPPKGKKGNSSGCEVVPPLPKKPARRCKSAVESAAPLLTKELPSTRSTKASTTDEDTQDDEIVQDSSLSSRVKNTSVNSGQDPIVSGEKVEKEVASEHASTPSNDAFHVHSDPTTKAHSSTSPVVNASEVPPAIEALPADVTSSQALTVIPISSVCAISTEVHPMLSSLLSEEDVILLSDFSTTHDGFLLPESSFPVAFMKLAYTFFDGFLRFVRAHPFLDLLSVQKAKLVEDLKTLHCFGFAGSWLDDLFAQFDRTVPAMAFEDLQQARKVVRLQE
ncbi:hypothetical protein SESBI_00896 [Sesbania bispinosa]|nr:hypothetical protein SESBI_00896 [Sesbania bispinosa]